MMLAVTYGGFGRDIFVSYAEADHDLAVWAAFHLEQAGYTVVLEAWDAVPGGSRTRVIQRGLSECEKVVVLFSQAYRHSLEDEAEWLSVYSSDPSGQKRRLLLIRTDGTQPVGLLAHWTHLDLSGSSPDDGPAAAEALLTFVQRSFGSERHAPHPPRFPGNRTSGGARSGRPARTRFGVRGINDTLSRIMRNAIFWSFTAVALATAVVVMVLNSDTSGAKEARRVEKYQQDVLTVCPQLVPVHNLMTLFLTKDPRAEVGRKVDMLESRFNELWKETPPELADKAKAADAAAVEYVATWRAVLAERNSDLLSSAQRTTSTLEALENRLTSLAGAECKSIDSNDLFGSLFGGSQGRSQPTSKPSG